MIISHQYKFIFIKTYKTAGTSLEVYLSQVCGSQDVVTPIYPHVEPHQPRNHLSYWMPFREILGGNGESLYDTAKALYRKQRFYNHIPAALVRARIPRKIWDSYFKFSIERNPWDRVLSFYHMMKDREQSEFTLDEYLSRGRQYDNASLYCDQQGQLLVDRVVRYERLYDELGEIFAQLSVPYDGSLGVRAKGGHRKDRRSYQEVLTEEQKRIIGEMYADEIAMHGYTFEA